MYGSECWTLRKEDERKILVTEMCWLRRILGISKLQHTKNVDIRARAGMQVNLVSKRLYGVVVVAVNYDLQIPKLIVFESYISQFWLRVASS